MINGKLKIENEKTFSVILSAEQSEVYRRKGKLSIHS